MTCCPQPKPSRRDRVGRSGERPPKRNAGVRRLKPKSSACWRVFSNPSGVSDEEGVRRGAAMIQRAVMIQVLPPAWIQAAGRSRRVAGRNAGRDRHDPELGMNSPGAPRERRTRCVDGTRPVHARCGKPTRMKADVAGHQRTAAREFTGAAGGWPTNLTQSNDARSRQPSPTRRGRREARFLTLCPEMVGYVIDGGITLIKLWLEARLNCISHLLNTIRDR